MWSAENLETVGMFYYALIFSYIKYWVRLIHKMTTLHTNILDQKYNAFAISWQLILTVNKQERNKIFFFPVALQSCKNPATSQIGGFLNYIRHMVGLLGRVINPSQGLYLHRTTQHRKTRDKHSRLGRDSNPRSQQPTGQDPRLRQHGHCDRKL
jgi:hypothetical protein